jgi:hypothetical protein
VELNRNQFFMAGVFLMLLGVQFRLLDSVTLNEKATEFLANHTSASASISFIPSAAMPKKTLHPPQALGWALMSIGAVCILHSLAMKKPGG